MSGRHPSRAAPTLGHAPEERATKLGLSLCCCGFELVGKIRVAPNDLHLRGQV